MNVNISIGNNELFLETNCKYSHIYEITGMQNHSYRLTSFREFKLM